MTWVNRLAAIFPVRLIRVEDAVFDTQLMADAEIAGVQYQEGDLLGWQLRSYVFHRDGRVCVYCDRANDDRYELNHIVPRSLRGSDRASNLVVACHECNVRKGNASVAEFLSGAIGSGDLVRFLHRRYGTVTGHGALIGNKTRVAINHAGRQVSVRVEVATLLARSKGYRVLAEENAPTGHSEEGRDLVTNGHLVQSATTLTSGGDDGD